MSMSMIMMMMMLVIACKWMFKLQREVKRNTLEEKKPQVIMEIDIEILNIQSINNETMDKMVG